MQYNFDVITDRKGTDSLKWEESHNAIPMWLADMDFQTAPEIIEALSKRVDHGIFGYNVIPKRWNEAICGWWKERHDYNMKEEWLIFSTGVVPAISSIVRKITIVAENVLILTPVYNIFFNSIVNNGRNVLECQLDYINGEYEVNYSKLEEMLSDPQTTMMIFCNPHNPVGKIWSKDELIRISTLCEKYSVVIVSDEIHCDLTEPGFEYIPFASVSKWCEENIITCLAPTKAFNLAGLQTAAVMIPNPNLRKKVERGLNTDEVAEPNSFAVEATMAAFTKGESWLNELRKYIFDNKKLVEEFLDKELPLVKLTKSRATYLLWLDCNDITSSSNELCDYIKENYGVMLASGQSYGKSGNGFLRMNIACPREVLREGLDRFKKGIIAYEDLKRK